MVIVVVMAIVVVVYHASPFIGIFMIAIILLLYRVSLLVCLRGVVWRAYLSSPVSMLVHFCSANPNPNANPAK